MNRIFFMACLATTNLSLAANAQQLKNDAIQKSHWYTAPREFQILDERPVVRDMREGPDDAGTTDFSGQNPGGKGPKGAPFSTVPANGLHLGDPHNQGFRSAPAGLSTLPKSGFGGPSNIPARGLGPRQALPGVSQHVFGKIDLPPKNTGVQGPAGGVLPSRGRSVGSSSAPAVQSYSGGYGTGTGAATGSASRTETAVSGKLFKRGSLLGK